MSLVVDQFKRQIRRYPVAATSFALLLLLGVADYFLWKRTSELTDTADRRRQEGESMLLSLSNQSRFDSHNVVAQEALALIAKNLITEGDLAGNLDYFYQIEKKAHIRLTSISQLSSQPVRAESAYRAVPFSLRLAGPYSQLLAYVHELETGPRLLRVKNYRFSQTLPSADQISLDLTVEVLGRP